MAKYPEAKIALNKKTNTDLLASFIPKEKIIFPSFQLEVNPNNAGWWKNDGKDLLSWRDFLQTKYGIDNKDFDLGGGWSVGEGEKQFTIYNLQFTKGETLLARVMESSRSGQVSFYQGDSLVSSINTKTKDSNVRWFDVGALPGTGDLTIKTQGDINIINALALVNEQELEGYKKNAADLEKRVTFFKPENVSKKTSSVNYQKINQTKYKITVSGLTGPQMIVFSSSFHSGWKLNGESSIAAYGFLNGFRVDKNGEYILEFDPQKHVQTGLIVSLVSLFFLVTYLLVTRKNK
jgi:hypothetical protein